MPTSIPEVMRHFEGIGCEVMLAPDREDECGLSLQTDSYVHPGGEKILFIACRVEDEGRYLELFVPSVYRSRDCRYRSAFFAALMQVSLMTKYLQVEHDPADGEVRFSVDLPVMDATLTREQLHVMTTCLYQVCEQYHPVLVHAMETGKVDFGRRWSPEAAVPPIELAKPPLPPELVELIAKMGGIAAVESLLARHRPTGGAA